MSKIVKVRASFECGFDVPEYLETHLKNDNYSGERYALANARVVVDNIIDKNSKYNVNDFNYKVVSVDELNEDEYGKVNEYFVEISIDFNIEFPSGSEKNMSKINDGLTRFVLAQAHFNIIDLLSKDIEDITPDTFNYEIISVKNKYDNNKKIINFDTSIL